MSKPEYYYGTRIDRGHCAALGATTDDIALCLKKLRYWNDRLIRAREVRAEVYLALRGGPFKVEEQPDERG